MPGILPHAVELFHELRREDLAQRPGQRLPARQGVHDFHLRVPGFDAVRQVDRHHAHVDRLDDVFVEVLQAFVLGDLLFERGVQARILDGDADVAGQGFQQFDVFAGQEIAFHRLAQAEECNRPLLGAAGNVVVQVQPGDGLLRAGGLARHLVHVLQEKMSRLGLRPGGAEEVQIQSAGLGHAERLGQNELWRLAGGEENRHAIDQQGARQAIDHRTQHLVEIGFRAELASKFDQRLAVVVAGAIEELVDPLLDPFAYRIEQQRRDHHRQHQADRSRTRHLGVDQFGHSGHHREVDPDDRGRRQRVHHAALEDQVYVHQAVAEDGIPERQRQQAQRQHGHLHRRARHRSPVR